MAAPKPPLTVYVVWHPKFGLGQTIADHIYNLFTRNTNNPESIGINIPVNYRFEPLNGNVPKDIDFDVAEKIAVVVFVDEKLHA